MDDVSYFCPWPSRHVNVQCSTQKCARAMIELDPFICILWLVWTIHFSHVSMCQLVSFRLQSIPPRQVSANIQALSTCQDGPDPAISTDARFQDYKVTRCSASSLLKTHLVQCQGMLTNVSTLRRSLRINLVSIPCRVLTHRCVVAPSFGGAAPRAEDCWTCWTG